MDNPHHQWHFRPPPPPPPPQATNMCPVCSNCHFPFCPLPPYAHPSPRFPTRPGFDPRPWHEQNPVQPVYDYYGGANGFAGEYDWNYNNHNNKRMRVDENSNYRISSENERRLKLIRDHGGDGSRNAPFLESDGINSYENHVGSNNFVHVNDWQNYVPHNQPPPPLLPPLPPLPPPQHGYENFNVQGGYLPHYTNNSNSMGQPPLPKSPPPPMPAEPPLPHPSEFKACPLPPPVAPALPTTSLFPVPVNTPSSYPPISHASAEESRLLPIRFSGESQSFPPKQLSPDGSKVVNALYLFKHPHRATRPDHFVIILRGLPGSGKSYMAKMLRDLEVENGGDVPRIHSIDDYFMTEVEKVEEVEISKSSGSLRSKKPVMKQVMEYCYEPEMEEAYRSSMLKAFKRTLEEGSFTFVIDVGL